MTITLAPLHDELLDGWIAANEESRGETHTTRLLRFWQEMLEGKRLILTAWEGDKFIGHITLQHVSHYPAFRKAGIPEIVDVWVQPEARRKGAGQKLLDAAITAAKKYQALAIGMGVGVTQEYGSAHILYGKNGFAPDGSGLWVMGRRAEEFDEVILSPEAILMWVKNL